MKHVYHPDRLVEQKGSITVTGVIVNKRSVESCLTIGPPRGSLRDIRSLWYWNHHVSFVDYRVSALPATLHLSFDREGLAIQQDIQLVSTEPNYGGVRWWFLCPKCDRRVSRLYLPTRGCFRFFCRLCYDLTYESAKCSRKKSERFFRLIARDLDSTPRLARMWFRVTRRGVVPEIKRPIIDRVRDRRTGLALRVTKQARMLGLSV